jgi:hypothetical protein
MNIKNKILYVTNIITMQYLRLSLKFAIYIRFFFCEVTNENGRSLFSSDN